MSQSQKREETGNSQAGDSQQQSHSLESTDIEAGSASSPERINKLRDQFEAEWASGRQPGIEAFLALVPEGERPVLFRELLAIELQHRRRNQEEPLADEYHQRFPGCEEQIRQAFRSTQEPRRDKTLGPVSSGEDLLAEAIPERCLDPTLTYSVQARWGDIDTAARPQAFLRVDEHRKLESAFAPGTVIQNRYVLQRELGRGGMGQVYLARDLRLDRPVAVKVSLLLGRDDAEQDPALLARMQQAFAEEARLGANLTHSAIATVFDYGFHEGMPFTVFEYLPGETLRGFLRRRGRLPLDEVRLIIGRLAQALDFAHTRYVVHRGLKPENIRATGEGDFKILDLGLAKEFGRDVDWTGFAGTPAYASPEQASGLPCDGRADQYALALIAYEMLAGRRLFESSDCQELLDMHRSRQPTSISQVPSEIPEAVRAALGRALHKSPNERFGSCSELATALGCPMLMAPVPVPEIIRETSVEGMSSGWLRRRVSFGWLGNRVHLVLTRDTLWSSYHTEVECWPLQTITDITPRVPPGDMSQTAESRRAEAIRRAHASDERMFRLIGTLHLVSAILAIAITLLVLGVRMLAEPSSILSVSAPGIRGGMAIVTLGIVVILVGRGLRRFRRWARRAVIGEASLLLLAEVGFLIFLVAVAAARHHSGPLVLLALISPAVLLTACVLAKLASGKGAVVVSPDYREILARTPHLDPRKSFELFAGARRTLRLTLRGEQAVTRQSFRFPSVAECRVWSGLLHSLRQELPSGGERELRETQSRPVVLLSHSPMTRYQVLGQVEAAGEKLHVAQAGLQIRGSMMGADAVINVREERLPEFAGTLRRLSGAAVRAVEPRGRYDFRARWYASRIAKIAAWGIALLVVGYFANLFGGFMMLGFLSATGELSSGVFPTALVVAATIVTIIHLCPLTMAVLLFWLRWPQLVRPFATMIPAWGLRPVFCLFATLMALVWGGHWSGAALNVLGVVDPSNLVLLLFALFLGRIAWKSFQAYRQLVPDPNYKRSPLRRACEILAGIASIGFALSLAAFVSWAAFRSASTFRLPLP